jgi:hypothetical protein
MPSTTASWARPIQSFSEITQPFKAFFPNQNYFREVIEVCQRSYVAIDKFIVWGDGVRH